MPLCHGPSRVHRGASEAAARPAPAAPAAPAAAKAELGSGAWELGICGGDPGFPSSTSRLGGLFPPWPQIGGHSEAFHPTGLFGWRNSTSRNPGRRPTQVTVVDSSRCRPWPGDGLLPPPRFSRLRLRRQHPRQASQRSWHGVLVCECPK